MKKFTMLFVCLVMLGVQLVNAQQRTITGRVTSSEDGSSLPGVSVSVKGTTTGTITNVDGDYSLAVSADVQTLVYSFVGMLTKEVVLGSTDKIDVVMEPEVIGVDEVVVTAFGISRDKKTITYQTEKVSGEDLLVVQPTTAAQGLVGKVAGMQVNIQDNGVNPKSQILLRGMRSISGSNTALVVIDGSIAPSEAFDALNANDIESINVLKGATAAALYGSDAANGAVIVTTKSGNKNNRFTVGYSNASTFETVAYMPDFQTEYGTGWDGEYNNIENTNWGPRFDGRMRQIGPTFEDGTYQAVPYAPVKDNLKEVFNTGTTYQNTLYLSGGDETSSFYMSIGDQSTKGIVPDDVYDRNTFRVNAKKRIGKIELGVNTTFMMDEKDVVGDQVGDQNRPFYWFILNTPANIPLSSYSDWDNPESFGYADNYFNAFYQNPYWAIGTNRMNEKENRFNGNMFASWDILENLNFRTTASANTVSGVGKNWRAGQDYNAVLQPYHTPVTSFVEDTEWQDARYTFNAILRGNYDITEDISLIGLVGSAVKTRSYRDSYIRANSLSIPGFYDISNGTGEKSAEVDAEQRRSVGFFGSVDVGYMDWAFVSVTGRQDYTSTLSSDNNGYFYPAFGANVILTEAVPALQSNRILSFAKVTANNSTVYNDLDPYRINERYSQNRGGAEPFAFPYGSVNGFFKARTAVDENISKEKLNSTELSLNTAFLNGKFTLDGSYFMTKTTDLITETTPSVSSGAEYYLTNIGELKGSGFELAIGAEVLNIADFVWDMNLSYYAFNTEVVEIKKGVDEVGLDVWGAGYGTYAVVDESFPQLKAVAYVRDGQGRIVVDETSGNPVVGEIENMGQTLPKYTFTGTSNMSYKGVTLSGTFDYRGGHVYYSQGQDRMEFTGRSMESVQSNRQDFVWPNSVIETSPAVFDAEGNETSAAVYAENTDIEITGGRMDFWQNQYNNIKENYVKDATTLKIRELALSYQLPANLVSKTKYLQKVRVGLIARNVLTLQPKNKYRFSDPEFRNTRDNIRSYDDPNGVGVGGYFTSPPTRSFGFSVNVEF
ncbi:MAG: SusC/RagA family TonB-linked outer membrane protein [Salinivirgaceae bacterium]|jgi:TonB-linked SusC/RagA family outer membrane protein|nr:SusC/RagA family TonB-linked outer membrane protein [Salinivirgaceae bacterium]